MRSRDGTARRAWPDDTIHVQCNGVAGQSFGAFLAHGITLDLVGDANDYVGKGPVRAVASSCVRRTTSRGFGPDHIIAGNTVMYGAIAGEAFFNGVAGERLSPSPQLGWHRRG